MSSARFGTEVVATRSTRAYAQRYIDSYADAIGATTYWDGQRAVPVLIVWEPVRNPATGRWDVVSTVTPRQPSQPERCQESSHSWCETHEARWAPHQPQCERADALGIDPFRDVR